MNEAIVDLETMGIKQRAAIAAIGIAVFVDGELRDTFYQKVDLQSSIDNGGRIDASTIEFWMKQSEAARLEMCAPGEHIAVALGKMLVFLRDCEARYGEVRVWGKGAIFDIGLLEAALEAMGLEFPWKFYNVQCFRTINDLFPEIEYDPPAIKHHALEDALAEGHHLMKIFEHLKEMRHAYANHQIEAIAKKDAGTGESSSG